MRSSFLTILAVFAVFTPSFTPSFAADDFLPRGYLPSDKELPTATPEQIDEALVVTLQCKNSLSSRIYYDCDCSGMKFLELRQQYGDSANATSLLIQAQRACPNSADVAGLSLKQCETWAKAGRPYNYKEFCSCFASEFARLYEHNTTDNEMVRESQMTHAYSLCDGGRDLNERLAKQTIVEQFKKSGLFKLLFPGANPDSK